MPDAMWSCCLAFLFVSCRLHALCRVLVWNQYVSILSPCRSAIIQNYSNLLARNSSCRPILASSSTTSSGARRCGLPSCISRGVKYNSHGTCNIPTMHAWTSLPACCSHRPEDGLKPFGRLQQGCKTGVHDSIMLCAQEPVTAQNAGERLQTRCERETLSRFPRTGAILFTIRTHLRKLREFEGRPDKVSLIMRRGWGEGKY